jgi:hypothetical protein
MKHASCKTLALLLAMLASGTVLAADQATTLGWVEQVTIQDTGLVMHAKIDTGADNSSINASGIDYFSRGGDTWVRFELHDRTGAQVTMERPLVRLGHIKRKEGGHIERPVVTLGLCVAGQLVDAEVNLARRDHFRYQLLVGRSLMAHRFLVDPVRTYITRPNCAAA